MYINRADRRKIKKRFGVEMSATGYAYGDDTVIREAAKKGDELAKKWVAVRTINRLQPDTLPPEERAVREQIKAWLLENCEEP